MNDIYQEKAKKYKYKYLELKRLKRSIELEGGFNLWPFGSWAWPWESSAPVNEPPVNELPADEQTKFRELLISLKKGIETNIVPLYNDKILGNIDENIIINNNIKFNMTQQTSIIPKPEEKTQGGVTTDEVKNYVEQIAQKYPLYVPPIINCYFELSNNPTRLELLNSFIKCLQDKELSGKNLPEDSRKQLGGIFSIQLQTEINKLGNNPSTLLYDLFNIYKKIIRPLEKDIDYYALTKVICDEFEKYKQKNINYNKQGKTVNSNSLLSLFMIFQNHFFNNSMTKDIFLTQLDEIIQAI